MNNVFQVTSLHTKKATIPTIQGGTTVQTRYVTGDGFLYESVPPRLPSSHIKISRTADVIKTGHSPIIAQCKNSIALHFFTYHHEMVSVLKSVPWAYYAHSFIEGMGSPWVGVRIYPFFRRAVSDNLQSCRGPAKFLIFYT